MTEGVYFDQNDPIHSLLESSTNGGYHLASRVHEKISLSAHPEPGIAATTGEPRMPKNVYTGPCLMSPVDSKALKMGYNPTTFDPKTESGEKLDSYEEFVDDFLLDGGVPKLSQIIDHWGIQGMSSGTVVLMLEDEEWTDKVERFLKEAGISSEHSRIFEDVHTAYEEYHQEMFRAYVSDLLENDVEIVPIFTSEYSEDIDAVLKSSMEHPNVSDSYEEKDHYFQRIAMYTSPVWLEYLETELGLESGSLDISDPIRFYDEFYNYEGASKNIFREYQINYFDADNDDREREILFVPPVLAPYDEGYILESHTSHGKSITPKTLENTLETLTESTNREYPNLLLSPLSRLLTGFPNHHKLTSELLSIYLTESDQRPEWKENAIKSVSTVELDEEIQRKEGQKIRSRVQHERKQTRMQATDTISETVLDRVNGHLGDDLRTIFEPVRQRIS